MTEAGTGDDPHLLEILMARIEGAETLRRGSETETLRPITEMGQDTLHHRDSENDQESHPTETGLLESHLHTETGLESRLQATEVLPATLIVPDPLQEEGPGPGHPLVLVEDHHRLRQVSIEKVREIPGID